MAGTFSKMIVHVIFAVRHREFVIHSSWKEELHKYIGGVINQKNAKAIIVNSAGDHIHILIGFTPSVNIADLVREVKNNSTNFINSSNFLKTKFSWQGGYACFTCSHHEIGKLFGYIKNQEEHHKLKPFKDEYKSFLEINGVEFEEKYLYD